MAIIPQGLSRQPLSLPSNLGVLGAWQPCSTLDEPRLRRQWGQAEMTLGVMLLPVAFLGDTLPGPGWPFSPSVNSTQWHNALEAAESWLRLGVIREECGKHNYFPSPGHGRGPDTAIKGRQIVFNCWRRFHVGGQTGRGASMLVGGLQPPSGN